MPSHVCVCVCVYDRDREDRWQKLYGLQVKYDADLLLACALFACARLQCWKSASRARHKDLLQACSDGCAAVKVSDGSETFIIQLRNHLLRIHRYMH